MHERVLLEKSEFHKYFGRDSYLNKIEQRSRLLKDNFDYKLNQEPKNLHRGYKNDKAEESPGREFNKKFEQLFGSNSKSEQRRKFLTPTPTKFSRYSDVDRRDDILKEYVKKIECRSNLDQQILYNNLKKNEQKLKEFEGRLNELSHVIYHS